MYKKIALLLIFVLLFLAGCTAPETSASGESDVFVESNPAVELKAGDSLLVTVSMADSGPIKSMALSLYFDDDAFDVVDGEWLNQHAIIADFNMENKDAAIAFKDETNYSGEIFEFELTAKKDITVVDDVIDVEPILKNDQLDVECKGINISYEKK